MLNMKVCPCIYQSRVTICSEDVQAPMHNIMAQSGSSDLTPLQRQLLVALVESGISKDALLGACYELYAIKQAESKESADCTSEADQQGDRPKHDSSSNHLQGTPSKAETIKLEEASRRMMAQDARLATGRLEVQQMNFVDHMLRYVSPSTLNACRRSIIAIEVLKRRIRCCLFLLIC